jgi:site-specific DNA-adenine methylase
MNYINTALCYTGSKYKILNQLLPQMDYTKKYFVDLFAGSGVVGFML